MKNKENETSLDVVGIGNAIVDVLTTTNDSTLEKLSFEKGSMTLIDENKAKELMKQLQIEFKNQEVLLLIH
tara:strand:+ start:101 stop:313 length:213 start_codon:yes stop_codon:yes gene_type:complete